MTEFVLALLVALQVFFRTRRDTALEILALRHQVAVLKRKRPRPPLNSVNRLFWATLRRIWSRWADVLVNAAPGWSAPSLRVARSGIDSLQPVFSPCSRRRNHRRRAPSRRSYRGRPPRTAHICPNRFVECLRKFPTNPHPQPCHSYIMSPRAAD